MAMMRAASKSVLTPECAFIASRDLVMRPYNAQSRAFTARLTFCNALLQAQGEAADALVRDVSSAVMVALAESVLRPPGRDVLSMLRRSCGRGAYPSSNRNSSEDLTTTSDTGATIGALGPVSMQSGGAIAGDATVAASTADGTAQRPTVTDSAFAAFKRIAESLQQLGDSPRYRKMEPNVFGANIRFKAAESSLGVPLAPAAQP